MALPWRVIDMGALEENATLTVTVRGSPSLADETADAEVPAYAFFDSFRGFAQRLVLLADRLSSGTGLQAANGLLDADCGALQWEPVNVSVPPNDQLIIPLTIRRTAAQSAEHDDSRGLTGRIISPTGVVSALRIVPDESASPLVSSVRHVRLIVPPVEQVGLYEVQLTRPTGSPEPPLVSWPLWRVGDWVKPTRKFLLRQRAEIEKHAGPWRRSLAIAHVDRAMADLESTAALDVVMLSNLRAVRLAGDAIREDRNPPVPIGVSKLLLAADKGETQELVVHVPAHYDPRLAWPFCWCKPSVPNMITLDPIDTVRAQPLLSALRSVLNVDPDRCYLFGWCGFAYLVTDLIADRPEPWAAAEMMLRARWSPTVGNASNVPIRIVARPLDPNEPGDTTVPRAAADWAGSRGCNVEFLMPDEYCRHVYPDDEQLADIARWLLRHRRVDAPRRVQCVTETLDNPAKYWVRIDAVAEPRSLAAMTADLRDRTVSIQTNGNVLAYTLDLARAPISPTASSIVVVRDGRTVGTVPADRSPFRFGFAPAGFSEAPCVKRPNLNGPIGAALSTRRFLVVTDADVSRLSSPGAKPPSDALASVDWFRAEPVVASSDTVTEERMRSSDVILLGDPDRHSWMRRFAEQLPVQLGRDEIRVGPRRFAGEHIGAMVLGPNPLNPERYLLILAGRQPHTLECLCRALAEAPPAVHDADCVILEPARDPKGYRLLWADLFDWAWRPIGDSTPIARASQPHPEWQWEQWLANTIRDRAGADLYVSFSDRMVYLDPAVLVGPLSAHDFYRCFRNEWLLTIHLKREFVRKWLTQMRASFPDLVVAGSLEKRAGVAPIAPKPARGPAGGQSDLLAVVVPADVVVFEKLKPGPGRPGTLAELEQLKGVYEHIQEFTPIPLHNVDGLVAFLRENPNVDLDALLDQQPRPARPQSVEAAEALREVGL